MTDSTDSTDPTGAADYRAVNLANWEQRAPAHAASTEYGFDRFIADPTYLSDVVSFDRPRLPDLTGLRGVHLQCHIGTDTLSLARLGARMSGLDFSPAALTEARRLAAATGTDIDYVQSDLHDARAALGDEMFDFVFTGIGALCWLPDIRRWADVVASLLRPGGRLFLREGHPVLWSLDERLTDRLAIEFAYFERPEPLVWEDDSTYVQTDVTFTATVTHTFSHALSEIVTALLAVGLQLTLFEEHQSVPWEALPGQMKRGDDNEWRLVDRPWRLPHSYTLHALKTV
ncbi:MAG: class I SAM-dependent methyltransferase [Frankiaceae bacterium]|nr:class I SAM-dependent methyltransferase [Frankiaceae bacterium]MBV9369289.1 class I SAM-dependent methyltransferase [Frankiales bacterium]